MNAAIPLPGSSPHTRGALRSVSARSCATGIIPAYAGSTTPSVMLGVSWRDHPRIRGEHDVYDMVTARGRGSSPHTRGAPPDWQHWHLRRRIIPAYAGSTVRLLQSSARSPDHPRIRGEHTLSCSRRRGGLGSSPHTRGARSRVYRHRRPKRIIPAYAGSTSWL